MSDYEALVIGGGHNGLICAARLARAGQRVLLLERRSALGGAAATEPLFPDCQVESGAHDVGLLADEIIEALALTEAGLALVEPAVQAFAPQPDGRALTLYGDLHHSQQAIAPFSTHDAEAWPRFSAQVQSLTAALKPFMTRPVQLEEMGQLFVQQPELVRVGSLPVAEWLGHWFESAALLGSLGSVGVTHLTQGPYAQSTGLLFLYHLLTAANSGYRRVRFVRGGMGQLSAVLAQVAQGHGAEVRTDSPVAHILLDEQGRAYGVQLAAGETITAERIISSATPRQTLFGLVGAPHLPPRLVRRVKQAVYRGSTAKLNLLLTGLPHFEGQTSVDQLAGHIVISPSLPYLERAFEGVKYGRLSPHPYLQMTIPTLHTPALAPAGQHLLSITMQYAPYHLRGTTWAAERGALAQRIIDTLAAYAPGLPALIADQHLLTPLDWAQRYGLTEGCVTQGQMSLEQLFALRPLPIDSPNPYQTPVAGLYLCGAGAHPGGGVTGWPGYLAAEAILADAP